MKKEIKISIKTTDIGKLKPIRKKLLKVASLDGITVYTRRYSYLIKPVSDIDIVDSCIIIEIKGTPGNAGHLKHILKRPALYRNEPDIYVSKEMFESQANEYLL